MTPARCGGGVPARILVLCLLLLLSMEAAARLFLWWDAGRTLPLELLTPNHAQLVADQLDPAAAREYYLRHDAATGWAPREGFRPKPDEPWEIYFANSAGLRGTREIPFEKTPGVLRIACFGDSFTHGDDVTEEHPWPRRLEALAAGSAEALNFGVPGYGPDQCLLRYRELGRRFRPDVALLALTDEDAARLLTRFRPFYAFYHFTRDDLVFPKPRFELAEGRLELVPNPVPRLEDLPRVLDPAFQAEMGRRDFYYLANPLLRPPLPARLFAAVHVTLALLARRGRRGPSVDAREREVTLPLLFAVVDAFARETGGDGARFGVLLLTERTELERRGEPEYRSHVRRRTLVYLAAAGIPHLELDAAFAAALGDRPPEALIPGHYSPEGQAVVAAAVAEWLRMLGWLGR